MHAMEIQRIHLRGYRNSISQTLTFNAYEHCVSKKIVHVENILSMKRRLINREQIIAI